MAERRFLEVAEGRPKEGGFEYVNELLKESLQKIDERSKNQSDITGVATGLNELNEKTAGWQPGELIVLAARPSMGKTALALNFVEAALMTQEKPVLVFSLEMPADSLVMRMMSSIGRIDQSGMRSGRLNEDDWPKLDLAVRKLKDKKLFIDDTPGLSPTEMKARTRRLVRRESGAIEQDADVILFIYRDEYYNEDSQDKGVAEIIVGKQRNGETGTVKAAWVGKFTRFDNLALDYQQG